MIKSSPYLFLLNWRISDVVCEWRSYFVFWRGGRDRPWHAGFDWWRRRRWGRSRVVAAARGLVVEVTHTAAASEWAAIVQRETRMSKVTGLKWSTWRWEMCSIGLPGGRWSGRLVCGTYVSSWEPALPEQYRNQKDWINVKQNLVVSLTWSLRKETIVRKQDLLSFWTGFWEKHH